MVASAVQVAKRTLLATMRAVALSFGMVLTCNRDSSDKDVVVNFRKLALRVHPDRPGGSTAQQGRLNDARAAWEDVLGSSKKAGRPKNNHEDRRKPCADPGADGILMQVAVPARAARNTSCILQRPCLRTWVSTQASRSGVASLSLLPTVSSRGCRKNDCPLHRDVVLETPLRRYESSCHSKIQKSTHQK